MTSGSGPSLAPSESARTRPYHSGVPVADIQKSAHRIERLSSQGLGVSAFRSAVLDQIRSVMTVDAAFFATVDPATLLFTSAYADAPLAAATPLFLENEYGR